MSGCDPLFEVWKFVAELGVAFGTIALAYFTWRLAIKTNALAVEGSAAAAAAERQHRQQLMPLCKFSENNFEVRSVGTPHGLVAIFVSPGKLRNAGAGPALHVQVLVRMQTDNYGKIWAAAGPLGPGEEISPLADLVTDFAFSSAANEARIEIEYEDIFQQRYVTVYMHDPNKVWVRGPEARPKGPGSR